MKFLNIICILFSITLAVNCHPQEWEEYKGQMGHRMDERVLYEPDSEYAAYKYGCFKENLKKIQEHNKACDMGLFFYKKGLNQFAHYTYEQFSKKYLMYHLDLDEMPRNYQTRMTSIKNNYKQLAMRLAKDESVDMLRRVSRKKDVKGSKSPQGIDWTLSGCIDIVIDQGACGSCYAFAAVTAIESSVCIELKSGLIPLSKQQAVDCTFVNTPDMWGKTYDNEGCNGGNIEVTFDYFKMNGNMPAISYPYADYDPAVSSETGYVGSCRFDKILAMNYLKSYGTVSGHKNMQIALKKGPLSAYIFISENMYTYMEGIVAKDNGCKGIGSTVNHGVLIVGWGVDKGIAFWKIKNTWGTSWGERGYFRMALGKNLCNIEMQASYPIVR